MNKEEIREYISCPQFGDNYYGKWGALKIEQRLCIKKLLEENEYYDKLLKEKIVTIDKAIEYINNYYCLDSEQIECLLKILKGEE